MPDPRSKIVWDPATAQYRVRATGRFIDRATVRLLLDDAISAEARYMADQLKKLSAGSLSLDAWYAGMRQSIKLIHLWAGAAAKGGWAQLTNTEYGYIGSAVKFHYDRLARFVEQLSLGLHVGPREVMRVGMYAQAARLTYHVVELPTTIQAGYTEERNVIDPGAESCAECVELTGEWVPIGTLPRPGERLCLTNCRCHLEYRRSGGRG